MTGMRFTGSKVVNRTIAVTAVVLLCLFVTADQGQAARQGGYTNPVGSPVVPPTAYNSGLVNSPDPVNTKGNRLITGNVRLGRQFQGLVPYHSTTDFYDTLGSTTLDSFMRASAGSESIGTYRGTGYSPGNAYYSQTGTVTGQRMGSPRVYDPSSNRVISRPPTTFGLEPLNSGAIAGDGTYGGRVDTSMGSLSRSTSDIERMISSENSTLPTSVRGLTADQYETEIASLRADLERLRTQMETLKQSKSADSEASQTSSNDGLRRDSYMPGQRVEPLSDNATNYERPTADNLGALATTGQNQPAGESKTSDLTMQYQGDNANGLMPSSPQNPASAPNSKAESFNALIKRIDEVLAQSQAENTKYAQQHGQTASEPKPDVAASNNNRIADYLNEPSRLLEEGMTGTTPTSDNTPGAQLEADDQGQEAKSALVSPLKEVSSMSPQELSNEARRLMGAHTNLKSYSNDKSEQYMKVAEKYMAQGRFYRAADSYSLAMVYKPGNPLANAGKSHALFAAGEYMSSLLFLSRALEAFPAYAKHKVDLNALIGAETVKKQIADIKSNLALREMPELHFMLGYVYYRTGDLKNARAQLDIAIKGLPGENALMVVSKAVDDAMKTK